MSPSHQAIRTAIAAATGAPQLGVAFIYPLHRRPERDGWTTGVHVPTGTPAPAAAAIAAALHRPASAVQVEAVGACLFLTILDAAA